MSINTEHWHPIIEKHATDATQFLTLLAGQGELFGHYHFPGGWVFRGHRDARWPLLPTAFRPDVRLMHPRGDWVQGVRSTVKDQILHEAATLMCFSSMADQHGLTIPEDTQSNRQLLRNICYHLGNNAPDDTVAQDLEQKLRNGGLTWLPDELLSLAALAQHYGLPTRLLDWSHNSYAAAYFAVAKSAALLADNKPINELPPNCCVWALSILNLKSDSLYGQDDLHSTPIVTFTAPGATNPNLLAQRGVFTLYRPSNSEPTAPLQIGLPDRLDMILKEEKYRDKHYPQRPILYKISLATSEVPKTLRLLTKEFVNASSIFPGFDGVVRSLQERRYWDPYPEIS